MKRIFAFVMCIALMLCFASCGGENEDYAEKLISASGEQEKITASDVFSFEFDKGYVFSSDDCYADGDEFAKKYGLDISISQVGYGVSENVQRIVFVDESGAFVYEFNCLSDKVFFDEKGVIVYPETVIKTEMFDGKPLKITFEGNKDVIEKKQ